MSAASEIDCSIDWAEVRDELRAVARDLLAQGEGAPDWALLASSGWLGLEIAEAHGGAGATFAEVAVILEELGRAARGGPYLASVVLAAGALARAQASPVRDELLAGIASGEVVVAAALTTNGDEAGPGPPPFVVSDEGRVSGRAVFVPDASGADRLVLLASDPSGAPVLVVVDRRAEGMAVEDQPLVDATRSFGVVAATDVAVDAAAVLPLDPDVPAQLLDRAALAVALDSLGASAAMLDATVAYAAVREQFGRPIGSFQAVKHACADMLVTVTVARELVTSAVHLVATGDPGAGRAVAMAASYATEGAVEVVGKAMQLHGGIGYTWESGVHAHLKRALLNRSLFGSPVAQRARLAAAYR
jgi:alkylation response protein AidB-like acyl-CoA dehydrogenase